MAEAATSDAFVQVRGFKVDIDGAGGKEPDTAWESVHGGELIIEHVETTTGSDHHTHAPGHRSVGEIILSGAMTDKREALCQWINETQKGRTSKRTVTITEIVTTKLDQNPRIGRTFIYYDCVISGYVFPKLDAHQNTGNVHETVRIKPLRVELRV